MRLSRKAVRRFLIVLGTTALALTTVWLFRWKIAEDLVRKELTKVAADLFDADIKVRVLRGSLLTSIHAEDVVLKPSPDGIFSEFTIKELEIGYGLFGKGTLDVRMKGAKFAFARSTSSEGPDAEEILRIAREISRFRFPGRLKVEDSTLAIPDGPEFHIEQGEIDYGTWRLTLSPPTIPLRQDVALRFGKIDAVLEPGRLSLLEDVDGGLIVSSVWDRDTSHIDVHWGRGDGDFFAFKGQLEPELDATLSAKLQRLDAPLLRSIITGLPLEGEADLEVALGGTPETPTIDGRLLLLDLMIGGERIDRLAFPLRAEPGALVLQKTTHATPVGSVTVEARIPFPWVKHESVAPVSPTPPVTSDPPIAKMPDIPLPPAAKDPPMPLAPPETPTVTFELTSVEGLRKRLPEDIRRWIPEGRMEATVSVPGEGWKITARFDGERYEFPDPVGELTDYEVEAEVTASELVIRNLKGMLGGGPITASGGVDLTKPGAPLILQLKGTDLLVVDHKELARIRINPNVTITVSEGPEVTIKGEVEVPLALYYTEFGPAAPEGGRRRDTSSPLALRLLPSESGGFRIPGIKDLDRVTLDVTFVTTGECRIENSMIGAIVKGKLHLRGRASSPGASGRVTVEKGQVRLTSGLFLKINAGEAYLPPEPGREPLIRFEGSIGRFNEEILVVITGPMARPTLRLHSNPPRSQEDLLAMIAFGKAPGSLAGSDALGALTDKVRQLYSDKWPTPESEEGFFDRLALDVIGGSEFERPVPPWELPTRGSSRGTMVRTEYLLNEWLSVVAESDRSANLTGDLKVRLRFK